MPDPVLPWYRHRWPWLLMSGPAIVVVAGIATTIIAVRTADPMVADYDARLHTGGKARTQAPAMRAPVRIEPVEPTR
jgi:hypothetical protein